MKSSPVVGLVAAFQSIPDPRERKGRRFEMSAMLAAVVCGLLCGARGYRANVQWLHLQSPQFWHWLGFTRKPPLRRAFSDLLEKLPPDVLETVLKEWVEGLLAQLSALPAVPIAGAEVWDGKTMRGTRNLLERAQRQIARLDLATGCVLSRTPINADTNESAAALELLKTMILTGKIIVGDAAYCQREICQTIVDSGGDYVVTVKENQPTLLRDISQAFVIPKGFSPLCC